MSRSAVIPSPPERRSLLRTLALPPERAAPALLGHVLVRTHGRSSWLARIVETEAYLGTQDAAAHAFRGRTPRTEPLWGPPGTLYVYLIYGMYYCLNLAVDAARSPGCVLIRAAEPLPPTNLAPDALSGPGRLCRGLKLDARWSGRFLFERGAGLTLRPGPAPTRVLCTPRIGIRQAADWPLRFFDADSGAVSRGPRPARHCT